MTELTFLGMLLTPIWLVALICLGALFVAFVAAKRFRGATALAVAISVFLAVLALPFVDAIAGYVLFQHSCATKTTTNVYDTLILPARYWDEKGRATFIREDGHLDLRELRDRVEARPQTVPYIEALGITEYHFKIVDKTTKQVLGEVVTYMHWGGWISRNLSLGPPSGVVCERFEDRQLWETFNAQLFRSASSD